ncbi:ABC transporter ATP-binding protein [Kineosporia sp. NBRC 101677]|nr:ABC transporter ATP-binding protein [Kineosporia sp. NBRC 101677]
MTTDRLTKRYGTGESARLAADAVSLSVRRGEVYGFLGPNGAGKTTTLRMVLGLIRPTSGSATVLGRPSGEPEVMARVGALIEGPGFYPFLSGRENLQVMARYRGLSGSAAEIALERVDLAGRGDDRFRSYSLGMKQRLGVASALMGEPEVIVLDEPTNGLDPAGMQDMRRLIVSLAEGGTTVVLSSHLLAEVQEICDRVGVINNGRLLRESTVTELRGGALLRVRATPPETALAVAMRIAGDDGVRRAGPVGNPGGPVEKRRGHPHDADTLVLDLPPSAAPEVARVLVAEGADILEIAPLERSLEEVFFEMTSATAEPAVVPNGRTGVHNL